MTTPWDDPREVRLCAQCEAPVLLESCTVCGRVVEPMTQAEKINRSHRVVVLVTPAEAELLRAWAEREDRSVSWLCRRAMLEACKP